MGSRAQDRRRQEFEDFVGTASTSLLRAGFLLTGDRATAEDLLQTTLLRTFVHWTKASQSPRAYANQVLLNLARDRGRQQVRRRTSTTGDMESLVERLASDTSDQAEGPVGQLVERQTMLRALDSLPDRQREVVVLRFYMDMSVSETADILRIPEGTVKSTVSRAIERLREIFEPEGNDAPGEVPNAH